MSRYREKTCPTCGTAHKKRGPFCSRSCGNSRVHSDERKEQLSQQARARVASGEHNETADRFIAGAKLATQKRYNKGDEDLQDLSYEDLFVEPVVRPLGGNQFVAGGDLWTESD